MHGKCINFVEIARGIRNLEKNFIDREQFSEIEVSLSYGRTQSSFSHLSTGRPYPTLIWLIPNPMLRIWTPIPNANSYAFHFASPNASYFDPLPILVDSSPTLASHLATKLGPNNKRASIRDVPVPGETRAGVKVNDISKTSLTTTLFF